MRVELLPRFFNRVIHAATGGRGTHDLLNENFFGPLVNRRHFVAYIALGHDTD